MRDELIEELEAGFDPTPEDAQRELFRLDDLCRQAAVQLKELQKVEEFINSDPFTVLSKINVGDHIEKKNGLSYLSWAWAWDTLMRYYPDSENGINRSPDGFPFWTDGRTAWVEAYVTVKWMGRSRKREEVFPIMDYKNKSIPVDKLTSFDINTALQRAWTKCIARHGLGFYIYAGEDLPKEEADAKKAETEKKRSTPVTYEQIERIEQLYTQNEISKMLTNLKLSAITMLNGEQAEKMIKKRDTSLIADQSPTF